VRLQRRLPVRGAHASRWEAYQARSRRLVAIRACWRCEGCGEHGRPLQWAHLASRGNKGIGEPWASSPELTAALCCAHPTYGLGCHEKIDRGLDPALTERLRHDAALRLATRHGRCTADLNGPALDVIRRLVDDLQHVDTPGNTSSHE
jgi:hypothetical protein